MTQNELTASLVEECLALEKEIYELWSNPPYCPLNNEDWTDAHQAKLEYQWAKEELNKLYIDAQKKFLANIGSTKSPRTADAYYKLRKKHKEAEFIGLGVQ